ncbi:MAG: hypothetical protein IPN87_12240 [Saprospiraceae bacterium]|nr:hypothetical protein [Candidatus Brachybacter algidus]
MSTMRDLDQYASDSKLWIFTANRVMTASEVTAITDKLNQFTKSWASHNNQLKSTAFVLHNLFIIMVVDNSLALASGCSIDTAMRFIQTLQIDFDIDFLDRQSFVYIDDSNQVHLVRKDQMQEKIASGEINDDTLFYDTLIPDLETMRTDFIKPKGSFWMKNI